MAFKAWCEHYLSILMHNNVRPGVSNRHLIVSSWLRARDHKEGTEQQQQTTRWLPKKRLTRYQMDYLRTLRADNPELWTSRRLSKYFGISYVSVVKVLKSKFQPNEEVMERQDARAYIQREQRKQTRRGKIRKRNK